MIKPFSNRKMLKFLAMISISERLSDENNMMDISLAVFYNHLGAEFCDMWYLRRRVIVPSLTCLVVLPLCFVKRIDTLKHISGAATASVLYLVR